MGINLTAADTVILHDLDFNPEADRQAIDRAHRYGQTRAVTVYKMVCADTVDEEILLSHVKTRIARQCWRRWCRCWCWCCRGRNYEMCRWGQQH